MSNNYIYALAQRHAALERQIEDALKAPNPDSLLIAHLKKMQLVCRDRMREAIRDKRTRTAQRGQRTPIRRPAPALGAQVTQQPTEGI